MSSLACEREPVRGRDSACLHPTCVRACMQCNARMHPPSLHACNARMHPPSLDHGGMNAHIETVDMLVMHTGQGLSSWFRDTLGVAAWVEKQEQQRRKRAFKAAEEDLSKSGALTQDEVGQTT